MRSLGFVALAATGVLVSCAALLFACGQDADIAPEGGGPDADAQADAASPDAPRGDAADIGDGGKPGTELDAAVDGSAAALAAFPALLAEALCSSLTRCCFGDPSVPDGGAVAPFGGPSGRYDKSACLERFHDGFEGSNLGQAAFPWGTVTFDPVKAKDCLAKVGALSCSVSAAEFDAARTACFEAVVGKQKGGEPCRSSMECAKGLFCRPNSPAVIDGGVSGVCEALRADGGDCGFIEDDNVAASVRGHEACSWRGSGDTNLHCESYNPAFVQTVLYPSRAVWKCRPGVTGDAYCRTTADCLSGTCDPDFKQCEPLRPYFERSCSSVVKP